MTPKSADRVAVAVRGDELVIDIAGHRVPVTEAQAEALLDCLRTWETRKATGRKTRKLSTLER